MEGDKIIVTDKTATVPLGRGEVAVIDVADVGKVAPYRWTLQKSGFRSYAVSRVGSESLLMHRLITDAQRGWDVDHADGDGLNNRRNNIRAASRSQNMANVPARRNNHSGYLGVSWHRDASKWRATINQNGSQRHLGLFESAEDAARTYDRAATEMYGEFAHLNFPG